MLPYIKWYDVLRVADTGQYQWSPFQGLDYFDYPYITFSILELIKNEYIGYLQEERDKNKK